jgi:hypothetical protein
MGTGFNGASNALSGASKLNADGTILVSSGSGWTSYDGNTILPGLQYRGVVKIDTDGSFIQAVTTGTCLSGPVNQVISNLSILDDGTIVLTGSFTAYREVPVPRMIRMDQNGVMDDVFNAGLGTGFSGTTSSNLTLPNGQILVGNGTTFQGQPTNQLVRLNANGSRDISYNPGPGFNGPVTQTILLPTGQILVSGTFTTYDGATRLRVALLN